MTANLADESWDEDVTSGKIALVTEPFLDPATNKQVDSIVSPVFDAGGSSVAGFVGFDVVIDSLDKTLGGITIGENGYLELFYNNADYIYSMDPEIIGDNVSTLTIEDTYINNVKNKNEGTMDFTYEGIAYSAMSRTCDTTDWLVTANLPFIRPSKILPSRRIFWP